jgi:hypothetical protein
MFSMLMQAISTTSVRTIAEVVCGQLNLRVKSATEVMTKLTEINNADVINMGLAAGHVRNPVAHTFLDYFVLKTCSI